MSEETARVTAERVVARLLDGDPVQEYTGPQEFEERPGGSRDPWRQTLVRMRFGKGAFTGKRPTAPATLPHEEDGSHEGSAPPKAIKKGKTMPGKLIAGGPGPITYPGQHSRWSWRPESLQEGCASREGTAGKAWKKGKKTTGKMVAPKPGKVSYREALIAQVLENIKVKKAIKQGKVHKGEVIAKSPGKVSHRSEAILAALTERRLGKAMKGLGKKKIGAVAPSPGKVGHRK